MEKEISQNMYTFIEKIFPICRSLTGDGVRDTLNLIKIELPQLKLCSYKSGTKVFDWIIPEEWNIKNAYVIDEQNNKIIDFKENNLHVVSYSIPIDKYVDRKELEEHLHSIPELPDAIPYVTSYYEKNWGFCISENQRKKIKGNKFKIIIDSNHNNNGELQFAELLLKGRSPKEILISTYICHPSMANNELSGIAVSTWLAKYFKKLPPDSLEYSLRFLFIPETIGSISYIYHNLKRLKDNVIAGYVLTCIGDDNNYSFLESKFKNTISDKAAKLAFKSLNINYKHYSFLKRGSDERHYNSVGVDLPIASIMRSKYGEYKEYHTSLDNLNFISPKGLLGGYKVVKQAIDIILTNCYPKAKFLCEPCLGKYGLYETISQKGSSLQSRDIINLLVYANGKTSLIELSEIIKCDYFKLVEIIKILKMHNLISFASNEQYQYES